MLGFQTYWEPIVIGVDTLVVYLLYKAYKSRGKEADQLYNTPTFEVGPGLQFAIEATPDKLLDYVCIEGVTEGVGEPLRSQFTNEVGVVHRHLLVEHKSKRTQGTWSDFRRVVRDAFNYRPFFIANPDRDLGDKRKVEVTEILAAEYLDDYLPVVHDQYNPTKNGLLSRSMDLIFGEVTKGYQDTEKLLGLGVPILGVGKVTFDGKRMILQPPSDGRRYIVTTLSKPDVVRSLRSSARTIKIFLWICVVIGTGVAAYSLYKFVARWMRERESRLAMEEIRRMRVNNAASDGDGDGDTERSRCVICLSNPRDVIILNCGHVCLCADCAEAIPEPKHCPVCRAKVARFAPVYIS